MPKQTIGVLFGGVSVEHEVSVITGVQLMKHADPQKYEIIPVYIDKAGAWWTGSKLTDISYYGKQNLFKPKELSPFTLAVGNHQQPPFSVAILCFHGAYGEAGNVQGALELMGIPYQGPGVTASAVNFDKIMTRQILMAEHIAQPEYVWFSAREWHSDAALLTDKIAHQLGFPVFVKPANGGSTIGIEKVKTSKELAAAIKRVAAFDSRILVEKEVSDCIEVNVSVLGIEGELQASIPEQPIKTDEFLSYADKYERGGKKTGMASASRRIPAPISSTLTTKVQQLALHLFTLFGCSGVVRIDFFVNPSSEEVLVTELNTIPGSMSYYLWEATHLPFTKLVDRLVDIAEEKQRRSAALTHSFESNILKGKDNSSFQ